MEKSALSRKRIFLLLNWSSFRLFWVGSLGKTTILWQVLVKKAFCALSLSTVTTRYAFCVLLPLENQKIFIFITTARFCPKSPSWMLQDYFILDTEKMIIVWLLWDNILLPSWQLFVPHAQRWLTLACVVWILNINCFLLKILVFRA